MPKSGNSKIKKRLSTDQLKNWLIHPFHDNQHYDYSNSTVDNKVNFMLLFLNHKVLKLNRRSPVSGGCIFNYKKIFHFFVNFIDIILIFNVMELG